MIAYLYSRPIEVDIEETKMQKAVFGIFFGALPDFTIILKKNVHLNSEKDLAFQLISTITMHIYRDQDFRSQIFH